MAKGELVQFHRCDPAEIAAVHVSLRDAAAQPLREFARRPGGQRQTALARLGLDPGAKRCRTRGVGGDDPATRRRDRVDELARSRTLGARLRRLDKGHGVARCHQDDRLQHPVPRLIAADQHAWIGDDRQGAAAEHDRGREAFVQLARQSGGVGQVRPDVPALQRRAVRIGQGGREAGQQSIRHEIVVAPDVQERGDHRAVVGALAARNAAPVQARRRTSMGPTPAARQTSRSRPAARASTARQAAASQPSG